MKPNTAQLYHFACFKCRRSAKRSIECDADAFVKTCANCGGKAIQLGRHFKPPKATNLAQWEKVRYLVEHGFFFHRVRDASGSSVPYPATLVEAREFVVQFQSEAWTERLAEARAALAAA